MATPAMALPAAALPGDAVAAMGDAEFERWAALLRERTGMRLAPERRSFLSGALAARMAERGFTDRAAYYAHLRAGPVGQLEWTALVDRLTVQETRFFRDAATLAWLLESGVPGLAADLPAHVPLQAWSAGCATGEEAYTLAMLLDAALAPGRYFGVIGSDISLHALSAARRGEFPRRRLAGLPKAWQERYCEALSATRVRVSERLRRRTCFVQSNLLEPGSAGLPAMHIIYCQNVLIYFDRPRRERLLAGLVEHLRPGGLLVLGAGEISGWRPAGLERVAGRQLLIFRYGGAGSAAPAEGTRA